MQDADSVRLQQAAHQQHSCTLDECFQLYTKEEQVGAPKKASRPAVLGRGRRGRDKTLLLGCSQYVPPAGTG